MNKVYEYVKKMEDLSNDNSVAACELSEMYQIGLFCAYRNIRNLMESRNLTERLYTK